MGAAASEPAEVDPPAPTTTVNFTLNGKKVEITGASPLLSLNDWLRVQPGLTGTKRMCNEGGCGCCVVAVSTNSLVQVNNDDVLEWEVLQDDSSTIAINSCLCPLYSVNSWNVTTVEGIGSSTDGFHEIQRRLVDYNGSQCGYCTPGFVMSMYSLLQVNPSPSKQVAEDIFDGNICRCTGYRPILDAMKSFCPSSTTDTVCTDIEDIATKKCPKTNKPCGQHALCWGVKRAESDPAWYAPSSLAELAAIFTANPDSTFRLIGGDTGRGVYKELPTVNMLVSLTGVSELQNVQVSDASLTVGAGVSLTRLISLLQSNSSKSPSFSDMAQHVSKIANTPVRNVATWAGNVMLAYHHSDFPSDIFLLLSACNATLKIASLVDSSVVSTSLWDFLSKDMSKSVIISVEIPFMPASTNFTSYKIMPRAQNSKAEVNAAFAMEVDNTHNFTVQSAPSLVVGGGDSRPMLCPSTASYFTGKSLTDPNTLKGAMDALSTELTTADSTKKGVAQGLLFKFYLSCIPDHISAAVQSAPVMLTRPVSSGSQTYQTSTSRSPVGKPINKLEGLIQASGEAQYTTDIPLYPNEIYAAFVLGTKCNADIMGFDTSTVEQMPGFIRLVTPQDIPPGGTNNCLSTSGMYEPEQVFADYMVGYVGQGVALVLAETAKGAEEMAKAVVVQYGEPTGPPLLVTKDAIAKEAFMAEPLITMTSGDAQGAISGSDVTVQGQIECGYQYHFTMETQNALVVPTDEGYTVYSSTQWVTNVQLAVANFLGIPNSSVDVIVKRLGGGYGAKIIGPNMIAAACALGASVSKRPVRLQLDLETNMKLVGKRFAYLANYELGVTKDGIVNGIKINVFGNSGVHPTNAATSFFPNFIDNAYYVANWDLTAKLCRTNMASNLACRSPGSLPSIFIMESMMDNAAKQLGIDPDTFRQQNLYKQGQVTPSKNELKYCQIRSLWDQLIQSADVAQRKADIATFNKANRWKKRGLSVVPLKFQLPLSGLFYPVLVNIFAEDGTVSISHGGVEMGQGINTKVAQVAAMALGIPLERIKVKPCSTLTNANTLTSGGSTTSEANCQATLEACGILIDRMKPTKDSNPELTWKELAQTCYNAGVDLTARVYTSSLDKDVAPMYYSYGVTATEVELDVLTGQIQIPRVDILYDCGDSMNPEIDVGQVEGAFVMGLGYFLTEKMEFDLDTGEPKTVNTWLYKPPSSKDIPIDFRIELLKNAPNPLGVLGSKAVGEPPLCMSCSALFAVKRAIEDARKDMGNTDVLTLDGPATIDSIYNACLVDPSQFTL